MSRLINFRTIRPVHCTGRALLFSAEIEGDGEVVIDSAPATARDAHQVMTNLLRRHGRHGQLTTGEWAGLDSLSAELSGAVPGNDLPSLDGPMAVFLPSGNWKLAPHWANTPRAVPTVYLSPEDTSTSVYQLELDVVDASMEWGYLNNEGTEEYRWSDTDALRWMHWVGLYPYSEFELPYD
jgi:hypothetical protein